MIEGVARIRDAYRDATVAAEYVDRRFRDPLGALLHARQVAALRQLIRRSPAGRVLEVAPGPARLTVDIADLVPRGTFIDASAQMLAEANRRLDAAGTAWRAINGDAFNLPISGPFDLVYAFRFVRHFEHDDRVRFYREVRRVLTADGAFMFDVVNAAVSAPLRARATVGEYRHFDALLTRDGLERELTAGGLRLVRLEPVQRRYPVLRWLQIVVAPRSAMLARLAMELLDRSGGAPLEWIATCRRA